MERIWMKFGKPLLLWTLITMVPTVFEKNHFKGYLSQSIISRCWKRLLDSRMWPWTQNLCAGSIFDPEHDGPRVSRKFETFGKFRNKVWVPPISDKFMESREVLTFTVSYLLKRPRPIFLEKFSKYRFRLKHSAKSKSLIFQLLKSQLIPEILQLRTLQCLRLKFSVNQSVCFRKSIIPPPALLLKAAQFGLSIEIY